MTNNNKEFNDSNPGYISWAFSFECIQTILHYDLENKQMGVLETEIAIAKQVLHHIMDAFKLSDTIELFEFIKSHYGVVYEIDFTQLQQNLVRLCYRINYLNNFSRPTSVYGQYQRARFFLDTSQILNYMIDKQYVPDLTPNDLTNRAAKISRYALRKNTSKAALTKAQIDKDVQEEAYQRIKLKFANEGMQMFVDPDMPNHKPKYADKLAAIQDYGSLFYPDGTRKDLGVRLARRFYTRLMEDFGVKLKQNAKKKTPTKK